MTKHTPGPWRVEIDPMSKTEARTLVMPADAEMYGKWIALTWPEDDDQDDFENYCTLSEAEANARLIAAAPALVEALRALVEDMTEMAQANYREWPDPEGPPVFNDQIWLEADAAEFALVQQARAALKLAGEP